MHLRKLGLGLVLALVGCVDADEGIGEQQSAAQVPVTFTNTVNVTVVGSSLTKTGLQGWNAGASSVETLVGDGAMEFQSDENNRAKMAGLSSDDASASYTDIDFAVFLTSSGSVQIYEGGVSRGTFGSYVGGDLFRVQVDDGVVTYYKNGSLLYTSAGTPAGTLLVDTSLNHVGATITNVVLGPDDFWTSAVSVTISGDGQDLTKTGVKGWNAGAVSLDSFTGDGYVEFSTDESNRGKAAGLSNGDSTQHYIDIDFMYLLGQNGTVSIYENKVFRGNFGTYVAGDVFRVEVSGDVVTYSHNGSLDFTSAKTPIYPLLLDTSLNQVGATVTGPTIVGATPAGFWQNAAEVVVVGNSLTKTGPMSWTGGASTTATFGGDGSAFFSTDENTTYKMGGLSNGDTDRHYSDIDFAIYLTAGGKVQVYEGGVLRGTFGNYVAGDFFEVRCSAGTITYHKNGGAAFYTSSGTPTFPLLFDTSLKSPGATITNVSIGPSA
jgi:hypothetical protein